ncbi:uncharacterized protein K460DRAFT_350142 [Cucurbitaria berberidis CBS 394.84]|uniref:Uncharacterized protein n=1 Tax=Cucurbitaria berberidis CBS 394.84 TaxID=1168544 RepID=A0A9P4GP32_9PLEO|nr:uncharacterized protein K460DRAFT_350142 [Cucurbitaria berberidis CBS 394.84]KAF1850033.1 hypothetical protein K460DRAFT_350142 [Cucurbitaria berberidis CBS 394.84]
MRVNSQMIKIIVPALVGTWSGRVGSRRSSTPPAFPPETSVTPKEGSRKGCGPIGLKPHAHSSCRLAVWSGLWQVVHTHRVLIFTTTPNTLVPGCLLLDILESRPRGCRLRCRFRLGTREHVTAATHSETKLHQSPPIPALSSYPASLYPSDPSAIFHGGRWQTLRYTWHTITLRDDE